MKKLLNDSLVRFRKQIRPTIISKIEMPHFAMWAAVTELDSKVKEQYAVISFGGFGTSLIKMKAIKISIVEAVERWALEDFGLRRSGNYGFDLDSSSTGLAAYPRNIRMARKNAYSEAVERYIFSELAQHPTKICRVHPGFLNQEYVRGLTSDIVTDSVKFYSIVSSSKEKTVLCVWSVNGGGAVFGFATSSSLCRSIKKSLIEAWRHRMIAQKLESVKPRHVIEKNIYYWAFGPGKHTLSRWLSSRIESVEKIILPSTLIVDTEILGPWNPEIKLWRCLYANTKKMDGCLEGLLLY